MGSLTNPNTCPLCLSPLQGTYHHAPLGREWWTWRCVVCDPVGTPAYESVETHDSLTTRLARVEAENVRLREALREARPHIGDEYQRSWPDDPEFDAMLARIDAILKEPA